MKNLPLASVLLAAGVLLAPVGNAFADGRSPSIEVPRAPNQIPTRDQPGGDGIAANGRCGGVSFGTGARRCGDLSGGPAGGLDSRN